MEGAPARLARAPEDTPHMKRVLLRLWRDDRAEDLVEYGLLVAFAAAIVTVALLNDPVGWKPALVTAFTKVRDALTNIK
jgi:Flp pilus assembly pilin Flp